MSRDYKTRRPTKSTPEKGGSAFFGGFVGYALGLASAIGIWLYFNYAPSPFLPADKVVSSSEKNHTQPAAETPKAAEKPAQPEPLAVVEEKPRFDFYKILPGIEEPEIDQDFKRAAEPPAQPKIVAKTTENNKPAEIVPQPAPPRATVIIPVTPPPQQIAAVPPRALPAEPKQPPQPQQQPSVTPQTKAPAAAKEKIFLQAGSFRKNDEAENMKARLAMLGVFASVQPIDLAEKGTWYRVRIGPFNNKTDSDQTSASLRENGIETQFVKLQ